MNKGGQGGFTLYELLITLVVIAVILTLGVPNLGSFTRNNRVTALANDLHGSFYLARSEAARAKSSVTICASAAGVDCDGGADFADGWIVFLDRDNIGTRDAANEPVLKAFASAHDTIHINANATSFTFAPTGLGASGAPLIAMICDERGNTVAPGGLSAARRIVVSPIGRSTIVKSIESINASIDTLGVEC
jgi:type IV fimbrial biogenesis protein FimT